MWFWVVMRRFVLSELLEIVAVTAVWLLTPTFRTPLFDGFFRLSMWAMDRRSELSDDRSPLMQR
jgi:hypothetical protein